MRYRWYLAIAAVLFLGGIAAGLSIPVGDAGAVTGDLGALEGFARFLQDLPPVAMMFFILAKNVMALLFSFILSPLLCIVPVGALVLNGILIGLVAVPVVSLTSVGYMLAAVLPHGVIEIPALVIGEAAALSTGVAIMMVPFRVEARNDLGPTLRRNLKYLGIALALLVPAAAIETFVTPLFLR
jgi:stage II sporulation protein M